MKRHKPRGHLRHWGLLLALASIASFFAIRPVVKHLRQAIVTYQQAESDRRVRQCQVAIAQDLDRLTKKLAWVKVGQVENSIWVVADIEGNRLYCLLEDEPTTILTLTLPPADQRHHRIESAWWIDNANAFMYRVLKPGDRIFISRATDYTVTDGHLYEEIDGYLYRWRLRQQWSIERIPAKVWGLAHL